MFSHCCTAINSGQPQPRQPDKFWSWLVCAVGTFIFTLTMGLAFTYGVFLPVYMDEFDSSIEELSAVGSVAQGLVFFCVPLSCAIMAAINFQRSALLGITLCVCSLVVTSFIKKKAFLLFFSYTIPYGFGCSLLYASCVRATTVYFKRRQNLAFGIVFSGFSLGMLTLGPLLQVLIDLFGLKTTFQIMAGMICCLFFAIFLTFDTNVEDITSTTDSERESIVVISVSSIFKQPAYVITLVVVFLQCFATSVVYVYLVKFCIEAGITSQQGANQFTVIGVFALVSSVVSGRIMDHKAVNPFHVNQTAAFILSTSLFLINLANTYHHFLIFSFFCGIGIGIFRTTIPVLFLNTVKKHQVKYAWPIIEVLTSTGNAVGAPFIGLIIHKTGSFYKGIATGAGIFALSFLIPFLQYCFEPWRKETDRRLNRQEVAPSSIELPGFVEKEHANLSYSNNNDEDFKESAPEIHELANEAEKPKTMA